MVEESKNKEESKNNSTSSSSSNSSTSRWPHVPSPPYHEKEEGMRVWGILIFGLIGATVTTLLLSFNHTQLFLWRTKPYTKDEIKTTFKAKAMEYHPDQNQDNKEAAEAKVKEVMTSYEAIKLERTGNNDLNLPKMCYDRIIFKASILSMVYSLSGNWKFGYSCWLKAVCSGLI